MQLLPYAARIKTFSLDGQTTDSAPSMAAYMTGVKMRNEVISMSSDTVAVDGTGKQYVSGEDSTCPPTNGTPAQTLLELAKAKGRAVGAVSTTRVGHATPATTYAHVCNRNGYNTIAEQSTPGHANYNTVSATASTCCWAADSATICPSRSTRPASAPTASTW